jgi:hypothetical protein
MEWQRDIEVLTPLFNRGAYQDTPEVRAPSIRGMVRWWFRALGGDADDEKQLFGGMKRFGRRTANEVMASRLVFRVRNAPQPKPGFTAQTLPHKQGGQASPQAAFPTGARFQLSVQSRLGELSLEEETKARNALEVWLLLGALGLRANRAAGCVWPADDSAPRTPLELRARLNDLRCHWPVMVAGPEVGSTVEELRAAATDTVRGREKVFGYAGGSKRLASPVKFKVARLGKELRLLVFAPDRDLLLEAGRALQGHRSRPETWTLI